MKKVIFPVLVILCTIFSCSEDTVDLVPIGDTEGSFYENETQIQTGIFGVYQKLNFFYIWKQQNFLQRIDLLPSDDISVNGSNPFENFVSLNGNNSHLNDFYRYTNQLVARANTLLSIINEKGDTAYEDQQLKNSNIGELYFLRSLGYFKLWNVYGTAPVVTERIVDLDDAYPPNSTGTELLDQAINDLKEAINLLPENWDSEDLGRITKNSARGLLIKTLVFRGNVSGNSTDFTEAITYFNQINGISLMPYYDDNFDYSKENNSESLFEFQANRNTATVNGWVGNVGANDAFGVIGEINAYYGYFTANQSASSPYFATQSLIDAYEVDDPRRTLVLDPTQVQVQNFKKYITNDVLLGSDVANPGGVLSANNPRILRYADVILLAAEAIVRSDGSMQTAMDLINQVRERARNSTESGVPALAPADITTLGTKEEALNIIFHERRVELAGEESHRWYDLRRRHIAGEIDLTQWDFNSEDTTFKFEPYNINFPLPEQEVIQSPNLIQNEGY